jgi:L-threonylcarbamoyladenylate synthase
MIMLSTNDDDIQRAAEALRAGLLVAFPTETVYGLGADVFNPAALARVFEAKGRPRFDPLIVHIAALDAVSRIARLERLDAESRRRFELLASRLWPGPLTLILPKQPEVPDLATSGLPTVAVRFPAHRAAQKLIALSTGAVAAPSANRFGRLSPTRAEHVAAQLGDNIDFIIDGGPAVVGVESTVLDLAPADFPASAGLPEDTFAASPNGAAPETGATRQTGGPPIPRILRPGGVSREAIEALIGPVLAGPPSADGSGGTEAAPVSPGRLKSHYAPHTPLTLHTSGTIAALPYSALEGYLFFSGRTRAAWERRAGLLPAGMAEADTSTVNVQTLSETGNGAEAAARLFSTLYELDALGLARIHAEAAPDTGLGPAINDRLERAQFRA